MGYGEAIFVQKFNLIFSAFFRFIKVRIRGLRYPYSIYVGACLVFIFFLEGLKKNKSKRIRKGLIICKVALMIYFISLYIIGAVTVGKSVEQIFYIAAVLQ